MGVRALLTEAETRDREGQIWVWGPTGASCNKGGGALGMVHARCGAYRRGGWDAGRAGC